MSKHHPVSEEAKRAQRMNAIRKAVAARKINLSFEEARQIVRSYKFTSSADYNGRCIELHLPSGPAQKYKDAGWTDWYDFLGNERPKPWPTFEEARTLARSLRFPTIASYYEDSDHRRCSSNLPSAPNDIYKAQWHGWEDFLGTTLSASTAVRQWLPFAKARKLVRKLVPRFKIKSSTQYKEAREALPFNIPICPEIVYKDEGWIDWCDFLGVDTLEPKKVHARRKQLLREILAHRDLLSEADLLQLLRASGTLGTLQALLPGKSLSEVLDALRNEEVLDAASEGDVRTSAEPLALEKGAYLNDTVKISASSLCAIDRFAQSLTEEVIERLIESQLSKLRSKYITEGLSAVEEILGQ